MVSYYSLFFVSMHIVTGPSFKSSTFMSAPKMPVPIPENYDFGIIEIQSPSGNPIRVYDLERTLCDILRGSGSDIQIVGAAMKRYAASKDKDIHKLMQYAERLRVKPKVLRYMEILL